MSCQDVRDGAAAWADGDGANGLASAVAAHAASCPGCAAILEEQRVTRGLVAQHAAELRGVAPAALRLAVEQRLRAGTPVVPFPAPRAAPRRLGVAVSRWSVAAALVLAVGGIFVVGGVGGSRLFAAQLALDHYKCLLLDGGHPGVTHEDLESAWRAERGWHLVVPPSDPALGITLVGLRRCIAGEGQMAHVMYDVGGQRVSLFVVPDTVDAAAANLPIMGVETKSWRHQGRTFSLVGATAATSDRVVEFMRAHAR